MRLKLALLALVVSSLACMEPVVTAVPEVTLTLDPIVTQSPAPAPSPTPSPVPTATPAADTATILRPVVNVRQEPDGAVIGSLEAGDVVTVIECKTDWCLVEHLEQTVYIWRGCLDGYQDGRGCEAQ